MGKKKDLTKFIEVVEDILNLEIFGIDVPVLFVIGLFGVLGNLSFDWLLNFFNVTLNPILQNFLGIFTGTAIGIKVLNKLANIF